MGGGGGGGQFTRGAAMYVKLFERRRGVQSAYDGGGGGGGCIWQVAFCTRTSLSSGRGGAAAKAARGRHFIRDGGAAAPTPRLCWIRGWRRSTNCTHYEL